MIQTEILTEPVVEMVCSACAHPLDVSGLPAFTEIACPECHTPQKVPTRLGPFLLVELLGKGGMGAVYRGHDTSLDRWVAIKVMLATLGENEEFVATFRREAQAAAALNHPNIVQIYSFGVAHGQPYMVMELLEGGRLDQMIAKGELLNESLVVKICADVAEGLNTAAAIGLIHGDVKPENILLDNNGVAKVVDFGLARFKQSKEPSEKGIWGTPYYIAPEKIRGQPSDARSDIYSLGGTLFHALSLKPPFDGETPLDVVKARLAQPAPLLRTLRPDITPEVEAIVARMLEADPLRRYPTYLSLLSDIHATLVKLRPPPAAAAFGQGTKRGGKIILTKKKAGGPSTISGSVGSGPISIRAGMTDLATASPMTSLLETKAPMRRGVKITLIAAAGLLGLFLAAGGITWGILHHNRIKAERLAIDKEQARLNAARKAAAAIWKNLEVLSSNALIRVEASKSWMTDLNLAVSSIETNKGKLTDAGLVTESETSSRLLSETVSQAATGTLNVLLLDVQAFIQAAGSNRAVILSTTNATLAEHALAGMTNMPAQVSIVEENLVAEADKAGKALRDLLTLKQRVAEAAAVQQAEAEAAARERAEVERKGREEAETQRVAAEKERQVQDELRMVQDLRKRNSSLIQQNQFKQAGNALAEIGGSLKTEEGKAAFKTATERYRLIGELKGFIIAGVTAEAKAYPATGYKFGWLNAKDVLAADETKITVRGGTIPWEQVPPNQVVRFVKHYASNPDLLRSDAARYCLAAAIYVFEADAGSEIAQKVAAEFVSEALRASGTIEAQVKALLPEVSAEK
jgi:hypothetical protein